VLFNGNNLSNICYHVTAE